MRSAFLSALLFIVSPFVQAQDFQTLINGGIKVQANDPIAHSTVMITMGNGSCSGTLIAEDIVLTAAHCLDDNPKSITVLFAGTTKRNLKATTAKYVYHDGYNSGGEVDDKDIALVYFAGGLPDGFVVTPILDEDVEVKAGSKLTVAGYGRGSPVGQLSKVELKVLSFKESKTQIKV